jgi:PAS domain S-box-containing protein
MAKERQGFRLLVSRAVGVPILLLAILSVVLLWQVARLVALSESVEHSDQVIAQAHRIETVLLELQVATRGYLLTGDRRFLRDYEQMFPELDEARRQFRALAAGSPEQIARLDHVERLEPEWLACRSRTVRDFEAGISPAEELVDCGRPAMQRLRAVLTDIVRVEERLRNTQTRAAQGAARMTLISGVILTVIVAALLAVTARRQLVSLSERYEGAIGGLERQTAAARESEDRMFGVVNSAMDAIVTVDERQRVIVFNATAERTFGWPANEIIGQPLDWLLPERFRQSHREAVTQFAETGETARSMGRPGHLLGLRRSGEEFPVEATISKVTVGGAKLLTVILRDITARAAAERALRESEERFRLFVEGVHDYAILMLDHEGRMVGWNPGAERITGYHESEALGESILMLYPEGERRPSLVAEELAEARERGAYYGEVRRQRKDGTLFWAEVTTTPIYDEQGSLRGFAKLTRDITERKIAQEDLQRYAAQLEGMHGELEERVRQRTEALQEVNAELNAFAYSVSHDLRAPLRSTQGFAEALLEDYGDRLDETGRDYAKRVVKASRRMDLLIQDLLAYSRVSRTELDLQPVSLEQAVESALTQLDEPRARSDAQIAVGSLDHWVLAHRVTLTQVLVNLLSNSIKFVEPGQTPHIAVSATRQGEWVRLVIEDNGVGIPPEHADRIFRVFERLHSSEAYPGTGIGLAIVRKALERMGGRTSVNSSPGSGSRFWIELPEALPGTATDLAATDSP